MDLTVQPASDNSSDFRTGVGGFPNDSFQTQKVENSRFSTHRELSLHAGRQRESECSP